MIRSKNITVRYSSSEYCFPDIELNEKEELLLLGPSGSGKSTIIRVLSGLQIPFSGHVFIKGTDLTQLNRRQRDGMRAKYIGIVTQENYFVNALNCLENVQLALWATNKPRNDELAQQLMDKLHIFHLQSSFPHEISSGERQRLSLCRALVTSPQILFADEPTSSLDDHNCEEALKLIKSICAEEKLSLVIASHDNRIKSGFSKVLQL